MARARWWDHRVDEPLAQQQQQPGSAQELDVVEDQESHVAARPRPSTGTAESLQQRGNGRRGTELDDTVEVPDVDAEFQGRGRDDDAIPGFRERGLRPAPLVHGEGGVRGEGLDPAFPQPDGHPFDGAAGVGEDQPFLPHIELGEHERRVGLVTDVVERQLRDDAGSGHLRRDDGRGPLPSDRPLEPPQQLLRVADRGRQADPLKWPPGQR